MNELLIRPYQSEDEKEVIELWIQCGLVVPRTTQKVILKEN